MRFIFFPPRLFEDSFGAIRTRKATRPSVALESAKKAMLRTVLFHRGFVKADRIKDKEERSKNHHP